MIDNSQISSKANADLPNLTITNATLCHTGGLLRIDTSVGSGMLNPMTHGAHNKEGLNAVISNDSTPNSLELKPNTLPQHQSNTLPQFVFTNESVPVFYMFSQTGSSLRRLPGRWRKLGKANKRQLIPTHLTNDRTCIRAVIPIPNR